jgi:folate-binding Fe-S cluster repair protein YgfZ
VVVVDRSNREIVAVPGEDRLSWLHTITSQHLLALGEGEHTEALVLDLHGHVEHHAAVSHVDSTVWLDTEPGAAQKLLTYLNSMIFWSKVEPREATAELAVLSLLGPLTDQVLTRAGELGGFVRVATGRTDLVVPRDELAQAWRRLVDVGATPAGSWTYEALRVAGLRPRLGVDTDERTIPHEVGWIGPAVPWTRAATGGRKRSRGSPIWVGPHGGWCSCTWSHPSWCRPLETRLRLVSGSSAGSAPWPSTTNWAQSR